MSSHLGTHGSGFRATNRLSWQGLYDTFRFYRINAGVMLPDYWRQEYCYCLLLCWPLMMMMKMIVCVCAFVYVRTTWNYDGDDRTVELHAPSIRQHTAWSGIFLDELIRDHLAQKFSAFYGTETFNTILTNSRLLLLFWATFSPYHPTLFL
jgi:hypothetical protein